MLSIVNGSVGRGRCGSVFEPRNNAIRCATRQRAAYARSDLFERRRRLTDEWAAYRSGLTGTP